MPFSSSSSDASSKFHPDPLLEPLQVHSPIIPGSARINGAFYSAGLTGVGRITALPIMAHMQAPGQSYKQFMESLISNYNDLIKEAAIQFQLHDTERHRDTATKIDSIVDKILEKSGDTKKWQIFAHKDRTGYLARDNFTTATGCTSSTGLSFATAAAMADFSLAERDKAYIQLSTDEVREMLEQCITLNISNSARRLFFHLINLTGGDAVSRPLHVNHKLKKPLLLCIKAKNPTLLGKFLDILKFIQFRGQCLLLQPLDCDDIIKLAIEHQVPIAVTLGYELLRGQFKQMIDTSWHSDVSNHFRESHNYQAEKKQLQDLVSIAEDRHEKLDRKPWPLRNETKVADAAQQLKERQDRLKHHVSNVASKAPMLATNTSVIQTSLQKFIAESWRSHYEYAIQQNHTELQNEVYRCLTILGQTLGQSLLPAAPTLLSPQVVSRPVPSIVSVAATDSTSGTIPGDCRPGMSYPPVLSVPILHSSGDSIPSLPSASCGFPPSSNYSFK